MKFKDNFRLRKPDGPHAVGCMRFEYEYDSLDKGTRIIPCLCFYPGDAEAAAGAALKIYSSDFFGEGLGGITTNSHWNIPFLQGKHPLLLFNHGHGGLCEQNTVQFEHLASHGYITLSVGHAGEGAYELSDGGLLPPDPEMIGEYKMDSAKPASELNDWYNWYKENSQTAPIEELRRHFGYMIDDFKVMCSHNDLWVRDGIKALDLLLCGSSEPGNTILAHTDTDRIASYGMSFGGAAALRIACESSVIKAAVNIDGVCYSSKWHEAIGKPVMFIQNDDPTTPEHLRLQFRNEEKDAWLVTVFNTLHLNFSDFSEILAENFVVKDIFLGEEVEEKMLGEIDPDKVETAMNILLLDFFDHYLMGKDLKYLNTDFMPGDVVIMSK